MTPFSYPLSLYGLLYIRSSFYPPFYLSLVYILTHPLKTTLSRSYHTRLRVSLAYTFLLTLLLIVFFLTLVVTYYRFVYNNIPSRSYHTRLRLLLTIGYGPRRSRLVN
jgi:predicted PurR-regulated permease PerM